MFHLLALQKKKTNGASTSGCEKYLQSDIESYILRRTYGNHRDGARLPAAASSTICVSGPEEETLLQLRTLYQSELAQLAANIATGSQRRCMEGIDKGLRPEALSQIPGLGVGATCSTCQIDFTDEKAALQFHQRTGCSPTSSLGRRVWYHAAVPASAAPGDRAASRRQPWPHQRAGHPA